MTEDTFKDLCLCGETTKVQFKETFTSQKEIAKEMIAFANSKGGVILFGVEDKSGKLVGLSYDEIQVISRELGNAANEQVRPTIYIDTEVVRMNEKHFLICSIEEGKNKPYKNLNGEIWVKQGADKRRITENAEILSLFQDSGSYQPDAAGVNGTTFDDLDRYAIDDYLQKVYATTLDGFGGKAEQVLKNIHILNHNSLPTLAGYLFFGKHPEYNCPTCMVKAVSFFGNDLAGTQYRDTKEILGNMPQLYDKSMAFLKANLHNVQEEGASFNTVGKLEIAEEVLEEVVQNALVHRDLLRSAPIRILIFDNRVEIISPGALAGGLTEEDIRNGKTYQRNPYMATFATNALHYKGIGSGIVRILAEYPDIQLDNDDSAKEFKVTVWRVKSKDESTAQKSEIATQKEPLKDISTTQKDEYATQKRESTTQKDLDATQKKVLEFFKNNPKGTRVEAANALGDITEDGVKFVIGKLQQKGLLKRVGGRKHGEWQVLI
ncbi:putative DNA binding domain-containing protein [Bacteroides xylanisolvens]|uniref:RNA-binding domain-containing protein n=1 Tax=Bacteroides xylanisolvens TaxID=371601 RepID=UPI001CDCD138|nr:RNA-binding domain-containing protein [Bacteroides xylanisolvens]MCA4482060.1 putative DNA binding domain-containing protein [Bacteroides xylanisolvens]